MRECPESPTLGGKGWFRNKDLGHLCTSAVLGRTYLDWVPTFPMPPTQPRIRKWAIFSSSAARTPLFPHPAFGRKGGRSPCVPLVAEHLREPADETKKQIWH